MVACTQFKLLKATRCREHRPTVCDFNVTAIYPGNAMCYTIAHFTVLAYFDH